MTGLEIRQREFPSDDEDTRCYNRSKDDYMRGHSYRVAEYSALIAKQLGWSEHEVENLRNAAYLHDIGKIGVPDTILNKPTRLTDEEFAAIKSHTVMGADILKDITLLDHLVDIARNHHERYDGKGYPDGLVGEEIPLSARIVCVADSYDAMKSRRIYRNALPDEEIRRSFWITAARSLTRRYRVCLLICLTMAWL